MEMFLKIVIIAQEFSHNGGAEKAAAEHYRILSSAKNDVALIGDFSSLNLEIKGVLAKRIFTNYSDVNRAGVFGRVKIALLGLFNIALCLKIYIFIKKFDPHVVHMHKVKQFSPLLYLVLKLVNKPVFVTVHDHYLTCLNSTRVYGDGSFCKHNRCSFRTAYQKKCVGNSKLMSIFGMLEFSLRRYVFFDNKVVREYVFPSNFLLSWTEKAKYNLSARVIPNFAQDVSCKMTRGSYVLFFGRLSEEKGVLLLPGIAKIMPGYEVRVIGDGPLRDELNRIVQNNRIENMNIVGAKFGHDLSVQISGAAAIIFPSICFENAPLAILESFMHGKPVVASDIGGIPELITDGIEGYLFPPGDIDTAGQKLMMLLENEDHRMEVGNRARLNYLSRYTEEAYSNSISDLYSKSLFD